MTCGNEGKNRMEAEGNNKEIETNDNR